MKLKIWELALCVALVLAVLWGALLDQRQQGLSDQLLRLHVLAHSDSGADQDLKNHVRDQVRAMVEPLVADAPCRVTAEDEIAQNLTAITNAATDALSNRGADLPVRAMLTRESFPTRAYTTFTLPAGLYSSLRIEIGEARGQNWWCVVFPPLCLEVAISPDAIETAGLDEAEVALITGEGRGLAMRFWTLEMIEGLRSRFRS